MPRVLIVKVDLIWFYATVASRRRVAKVALFVGRDEAIGQNFRVSLSLYSLTGW